MKTYFEEAHSILNTPLRFDGVESALLALSEAIEAVDLLAAKLGIVRAAVVEGGELPGAPSRSATCAARSRPGSRATASAKVHRAQLQSHEISGVQARHYDRRDYLDEKRAALEALFRLLNGTSTKVTPIRRNQTA